MSTYLASEIEDSAAIATLTTKVNYLTRRVDELNKDNSARAHERATIYENLLDLGFLLNPDGSISKRGG